MINTILFDLDGVLIDSLPVMSLAWADVQSTLKIEQPFSSYQNHIGIPFENILAELGIDPILYPQIKNIYSRASETHINSVRVMPYAKQLLHDLLTFDYKIALVTSKDHDRTKSLIKHLNLPIDIFITPESTCRGKPFPDPIFKALDILGESVSTSLFIGDMISDMQSARASGIYYAHFNGGYQPYNPAQCIYYGLAIDSLYDLYQLLSLRV